MKMVLTILLGLTIVFLFGSLLVTGEEKKIIKEQYNFNSKITEYDDSTKNIIIGGQIYTDSSGTKIKETSSLKYCEFCNNIKLSINSDKTHLINVINYNYTSLIGEFFFNESNLGEYEYEVEEGKMKTKLKIIEEKYDNVTGEIYNEIIEYEVEIEEGEKMAWIIPFGFDKKIRFGENSTLIQYNSTVGDGRVHESQTGNDQATWDAVHDTTNADLALDDGTTAEITSACSSFQNTIVINRAFFPIDTTLIPDTATITDASFNLYVTVRSNDDNDGDDFIVFVNSTSASTSGLVTEDFDECGAIDNPKELSNRADFGELSFNSYHNFTLNTNGLGLINLTGITKICGREGHDVKDTGPITCGTANANRITFSTFEAGNNMPYLNVTYTDVPPEPSIRESPRFSIKQISRFIIKSTGRFYMKK